MLLVKNLNTKIVKNVKFLLGEGKILAIVGPNGSGKTSLLRSIIGLEKIKKGIIIFKGKNITDFSVGERARMGIGYIFQELPEYNGITVNRYIFDILKKNNIKFTEEKVKKMFEDFGLKWQFYKDRYFDHRLSGGEKKKVEIILTFLLNRDLYLFDEVENNLDSTSRKILLKYILQKKSKGKSFFIVSHNEEFIFSSDRAILFCNGKIVQRGKPSEIMKKYTKDCLECELKNDA